VKLHLHAKGCPKFEQVPIGMDTGAPGMRDLCSLYFFSHHAFSYSRRSFIWIMATCKEMYRKMRNFVCNEDTVRVCETCDRDTCVYENKRGRAGVRNPPRRFAS
jgi:hypothetical protein